MVMALHKFVSLCYTFSSVNLVSFNCKEKEKEKRSLNCASAENFIFYIYAYKLPNQVLTYIYIYKCSNCTDAISLNWWIR